MTSQAERSIFNTHSLQEKEMDTENCMDTPFKSTMEMIEKRKWTLKHVADPLPQQVTFVGFIDIHKVSRQSMVRDLKSHQYLRHVQTVDKTDPQIPAHTKPLKDYSRQRMMDELMNRRVM